ncbi:glycosyltransferase family 4 protein [Croceicoccus sp. Ery15]|uniref:glycosyltransferase family 4 protein n=1 Tax=Croceicoccus sp. Ery15 TaxID=1703338 RepID=UPI001E47E225|nr:glycosyltransferase family 4 protein [Croceicoccus sp. Ery15]
MHILYFHQHFSTPSGAAGIRSYQMARRLLHHGHSVTMVCGSYGVGATGLDGPFKGGSRRGIVDGIDVIEFDLSYSNHDGFIKRSVTFLQYACGSLRLALTEPCDVVFATSTPLTAAIPGIIARWLRRKPFVFEVRDLWPELPKAMKVITNPVVLGLMKALERTAYRSAHRCIALAPGIARGIEQSGVPASKIAVIPNGCDIDLLGSGAPAWRPEGVEENDLLAIFTGTHGVANGLDAVLDAASLLQQRGRTDIKLALVGDGKLKSRLVERSRREGLDNVIFHPPIEKRRLAGLLAGADLGMQVLTNLPAFYYGTSPNKFFDYIAVGLPVLNNYPGWVADLIADNECGFVVRPDEPSAFADALEEAAADREALSRKGDRAGNLAANQFDRTQLADQWVAWVIQGGGR